MFLFLQPYASAKEPDITRIGVEKDETYTFHVEKYADQPGFMIIDYDTEEYLFVEIGKQFEMKIINTIPIIPNIRPAIAIPFESSANRPIIPNRIAAPGK